MRPGIIYGYVFSILFILFTVASFYHISSGEEGGFLYQINLVSSGLFPGRDFFSPYPFGFYAPYAFFAWLVTPSPEAGRLLSIMLTLGSTGLITAVLHRQYGIAYALAGLAAIIFNMVWIYSNIQILTNPISNFGLMAAYFFLAFPRRISPWHYFFAGLAMGIAINSRLIMLPVSGVIVIFAFFIEKPEIPRTKYFKLVFFNSVVGGLGIAIPAIPDALFFLQDPSNYMFLKITGPLSVMPHLEASWGQAFLERAITYGGFFNLRVFYSGPQNLAILFVIALLAIVEVWNRLKGKKIKLPGFDRPSLLAFVFTLFILLAYLPSPHTESAHLRQVIPFLILSLTSLCSRVIAASGQSWKFRKSLMATIGVLLTIYVLGGLLHLAWQITYRHTGGISQMLTNARLGCWLEKNTSQKDQVLSFFVMPLQATGRKLPQGLETGNNWILWSKLPKDRMKKFGIFSTPELQNIMREGRIAIVLQDTFMRNLEQRGLASFSDILKENYIYLGSVGGARLPYRVYGEKSRFKNKPKPEDFPKDLQNAANMFLLKERGLAEFTTAFYADISRSLFMLPGDIAASTARLFGLSYEARCGRFSQPLN